MSKDFLLGSDNGLKIVDYDFVFTTREEYIRQKLKIILSTFKGEWFLNVNTGLPFYQDMLGKNNDLSKIESIFIRAIKSIPEVVKLLYINLDENKQNRTVTVNFAVTDVDNNVIEVVI
jgi:hypothetical protein